MAERSIDDAFTGLPHKALAEAALQAASATGAQYADFRFERRCSQAVVTRDTRLQSLTNATTVGYGVRVIHDGVWGFAAGVELTPDGAAATAGRAFEVARTLAALSRERVELADEPSHRDTWISKYDVDPFDVPDDEKVGFLLSINSKLLASKKVDHVDFAAMAVKEQKYFATLAGCEVTQQRVRVSGNFNALRIDRSSGAFDTMRSNAPPSGRGWERFTSGYDFDGEAARVPDLLEEKMRSPSVEPGRYDLVVDPSNLWLTIHESVGHSTELDRVLGHEASYAGTSFCVFDQLGSLQYGSGVMHVTGDRVVDHGLSTVGYDDEGVAAQRWDIIRDGVLVGYQLNRHMAAQKGFGRSNGCAYADSHHHVPLQRMPNVSLQPSAQDVSTEDLISGVDRGIFIVGDKSWSIDQQRYNFQFSGQRFYAIEGGKLRGQLKDVAYQSNTMDFWGSMEAVGGPATWVLGGSFSCGKGQPGQVAPVSHGAPSALFRGINVLNVAQEG